MNKSYNNSNSAHAADNQPSWIVIGICLLVFWPVGLVLLIKKIEAASSAHKTTQNKTTNDQWQQNWRSGKWGRAFTNIIESIFGSADDSAASSSPYNGYYSQSAQPSEAAAKPKTDTERTTQSQHNQPHQKRPQEQEDAHQYSTSYESETVSKRTGKGLSIALILLGAVLGLGGLVLMSHGVSQYVVNGLSAGNLLIFILGIFCLLGGISCFVTRSVITARANRFRQYAAIIGTSDIFAISDISRTVGDSPGKSRRILQQMVNAGCFGPEAYLDNNIDSLVRSRGATDKAYKSQSGDAGAQENEGHRYVAIINELHMLCLTTADSAICAKIQTIEDLTAKIFRTVEDHPEKKQQVKRFLNFYLPTTIKLLHSYETLEKQGVDGENIKSAKQDIERILNTLITGFEQQLDHLFMSDKLDISSDIDVLENLMQQDGLTPESQIFKTAGGN